MNISTPCLTDWTWMRRCRCLYQTANGMSWSFLMSQIYNYKYKTAKFYLTWCFFSYLDAQTSERQILILQTKQDWSAIWSMADTVRGRLCSHQVRAKKIVPTILVKKYFDSATCPYFKHQFVSRLYLITDAHNQCC